MSNLIIRALTAGRRHNFTVLGCLSQSITTTSKTPAPKSPGKSREARPDLVVNDRRGSKPSKFVSVERAGFTEGRKEVTTRCLSSGSLAAQLVGPWRGFGSVGLTHDETFVIILSSIA